MNKHLVISVIIFLAVITAVTASMRNGRLQGTPFGGGDICFDRGQNDNNSGMSCQTVMGCPGVCSAGICMGTCESSSNGSVLSVGNFSSAPASSAQSSTSSTSSQSSRRSSASSAPSCANMNCDDGNLCTTDSCVAGTCLHAGAPNNGNSCASDGLECTKDECFAGECTHEFYAESEQKSCGTETDICQLKTCKEGGVCSQRTDCKCATPSGTTAFAQRILANSITLSRKENFPLIAAAGECTAKEVTTCDFPNSCNKVKITNTWSGPGCCDGGGTKTLIWNAEPGKDYARVNYSDACNGAGTGYKDFAVCPCSSSQSSASKSNSSASKSSTSKSSTSSGNSSTSTGSQGTQSSGANSSGKSSASSTAANNSAGSLTSSRSSQKSSDGASSTASATSGASARSSASNSSASSRLSERSSTSRSSQSSRSSRISSAFSATSIRPCSSYSSVSSSTSRSMSSASRSSSSVIQPCGSEGSAHSTSSQITFGVCRGDECTLGGDEFCAEGGFVCATTPGLPCVQCMLASSRNSQQSSTSQRLSTSSVIRSSQRSSGGISSMPNIWYCGDGVVTGSEECDDGNERSGDGCTASCRTELSLGICSGRECAEGGNTVCARYGLTCEGTEDVPCVRCVTEDGPACEGTSCAEGGAAICTSFSMSCIDDAANPCFLCKAQYASSLPSSIAVMNCSGRECQDGGNTVCSGFGLSCTESDTPPCVSCVNSARVVVQPSCKKDGCDAGGSAVCSAQGLGCRASETGACFECTNPEGTMVAIASPFICGNGNAEPGEECDDGARNSNAPNALCRADCRLGGCGDGILDTPLELCDDGNTEDNDGCSATCQRERGAPDAGLQAQVIELPFLPGNGTFTGTLPSDVSLASPLPPSSPDTGPAALAVMAAGAAAGYSWMRKRK